MKAKIIPSLIAIFILAIPIFAQAPTEGQLWTNTDFVIGLKSGKDAKGKHFDKVSLILTGILRFGNDVTRLVDARAAASLDFRLSKYFNLSSGYLHQKSSTFKNIHNEESRFVLAFTANKRITDFNFRFRQQYEYKFRNDRADTQNHRSLIQLNYFLKRDKKDLFSPFIGNEFFYDTLTKSRNRNEFRTGIARTLTKKITTEMYYIRLDSTAVNANGLGIGLRYKLR